MKYFLKSFSAKHVKHADIFVRISQKEFLTETLFTFEIMIFYKKVLHKLFKKKTQTAKMKTPPKKSS